MPNIAPIRTEFSTLIVNLSKLYLQEKKKAAREAKQYAKQKESSKNVNDDAAMSTSKDEGNVEGDLARALLKRRTALSSSHDNDIGGPPANKPPPSPPPIMGHVLPVPIVQGVPPSPPPVKV